MQRTGRSWRRAVVVGATTVCLAAVCAPAGAEVFPGAPSGEFLDPSPNGPTAVSVYNTTPSCPPTAANNYQCIPPASALPPPDPANPERYLNSAYWPAEKRPDIETFAINSYGYGYENCSAKLPHYCFLADAEAEGYPVTHTPQVGDLWLAPGECMAWGPGTAARPGCTDDANDWYMGYVDQVFPDGSFIESGGGIDPATDSGLEESWLSGAMDPSTDFIGFFPAGQSPQLPPELVSVEVGGDGGAAGEGSVADNAGQSCAIEQAECFFSEPQLVPVTLTATPQPGSTFDGWSGACTGTSPTCTITLALGQWPPGVQAAFGPSASGGGGATGSGGGSGTGSRGGKGTGSPTGPPRRVTVSRATAPRIVRVSLTAGTIRVRLSGTRLECRLARRSGVRWRILEVRPCGVSTTFARLPAGRYRLTVASGSRSVSRTVVLRRAAPALTGRGHGSPRA